MRKSTTTYSCVHESCVDARRAQRIRARIAAGLETRPSDRVFAARARGPHCAEGGSVPRCRGGRSGVMAKGIPANLFALDGLCRTCYRDDHDTRECAAYWAERYLCPTCLSAVPNGAECPCRAIDRESRDRDIRRKNRKDAARHERAVARAKARRSA